MLLQNIPQCGKGTGTAMLNDGVLPLYLAESAMKHFVGHGAGEENQKVRAAELVLQAALRFGKYLRLTLVGFTKLLVSAFHAFVAAKYNDAHDVISFQSKIKLTPDQKRKAHIKHAVSLV